MVIVGLACAVTVCVWSAVVADLCVVGVGGDAVAGTGYVVG